MSPRVGGEAAKFGARYEGRWTVRYLLEVLLGRVDSITVEAVDPLSDDVEFLVDRRGEIEGSTSGSSWRCDPPGDPAVRGRIVLYTRVVSSRDAMVVHRWYRDDTLRQAVRLKIRANASEGYRTYSRQTVDGGNWRVEVRSPEGNLLHELRFAAQ